MDLAHVIDDRVQVEHARLKDLHTAKGQELPGHGHGFPGGFVNLLEAMALGISDAGTVIEQIAVAANDRQ